MFVPQLHGTTRAVSHTEIGGEREGCLGVGAEHVGGWTGKDWASAVSSMHSHMAQCPSSTMLNDKDSPSSPSS